MPTVGYLLGVDPVVLTRLAVHGIGTLPISNGFDNHGKFINAITERDGIDLIIGYLHKVLRTQQQGFLVEDILEACFDCSIPVLVIVPEADHAAARGLLGKVGDQVVLVAPERIYEVIMAHLAAAE
jgi:hypothetical protein